MQRKHFLLILGVCILLPIMLIIHSGVWTYISLQSLRTYNVKRTSFTAHIARTTLKPFTLFSKEDNPSMLLAWDRGLVLLTEATKYQNYGKQIMSVFSEADNKQLDNNTLKHIRNEIPHIQKQLLIIQTYVERKGFFTSLLRSNKNWKNVQASLNFLNSDILPVIKDFFQEYENIVGKTGDQKTYLVLLQNNYELRPTGGFLGSYALITFESGSLQSIEVQDIYVPDGQMKGHVNPPQPIQEAFLQGFWKLRDANWHPDFHQATQRIEWFFKEGTNQDIDGTIALNVTTFQDVLEITGPLHLPDQNMEITKENFVDIFQNQIEEEFFPGSTVKKDLLSSFSTQLQLQLSQLSVDQYTQLIELLLQEAKYKNILFSFKDARLQTLVSHYDWTGKMENALCTQPNCIQDYFYQVDANLSVNKSNCCIARTTTLRKRIEDNILYSDIEIVYTNPFKESIHMNPNRTYARLYIPKGTIIERITINNQPYDQYIMNTKRLTHEPLTHQTSMRYSVGELDEFVELGFWVYTPLHAATKIVIETQQPIISSTQPYQLTVQKQPGVISEYNQYNVKIHNEMIFSDTLDKDVVLVP